MAIVEKPIMGKPQHRLARRDSQGLLASVGRYTRFVFFSKLSLGALALLMIVTIIILPVINADEEGLRIAFSTVKGKSEAQPVMTKPSFQGVDENNQPYLVTADSALQHDEKTIILKNVQADLLTQNQTWFSVKAADGTIDTVGKTLQLGQDVRIFQQDGYEFRTSDVHIDINARIVQGNKPVNGFGPAGEIVAQGFVWEHDKRVLRFNNVAMKVRTDG